MIAASRRRRTAKLVCRETTAWVCQRLCQKHKVMELAPLCVPVEIAVRNGALRCFRLALAVSDTGLRLRSPLPDELLREPLRIRLTAPRPKSWRVCLPTSGMAI